MNSKKENTTVPDPQTSPTANPMTKDAAWPPPDHTPDPETIALLDGPPHDPAEEDEEAA